MEIDTLLSQCLQDGRRQAVRAAPYSPRGSARHFERPSAGDAPRTFSVEGGHAASVSRRAAAARNTSYVDGLVHVQQRLRWQQYHRARFAVLQTVVTYLGNVSPFRGWMARALSLGVSMSQRYFAEASRVRKGRVLVVYSVRKRTSTSLGRIRTFCTACSSSSEMKTQTYIDVYRYPALPPACMMQAARQSIKVREQCRLNHRHKVQQRSLKETAASSTKV
eukprot:6176714-Pleurochrysis_carterae.AAC.1